MAKPPVAKLMDFGKYKYEAAVKAREARKNQTNTVLKEVRFRLKIDTHDYETKTGHARRFLSAGDKVKAMIQFRGREQQRPEMGIRLLQKFAEDVSDVGSVESNPRIDGRNMVMVIGPVKNKAEAKAEARRATQKSEAKAQKESKRVDVSKGEAPMTQTLGDTMPEGLKAMGSEAERTAPDEAEAQPKAPETKSTAKAEPKPAEAKAEPKPAEAKAEPKPAEAEPAAPKPAEAEQSTPKPAAEPAAPKPAGKPAAPKPVGKPAAPKPRASSTSKPAGKTPSSQSKSDADK
ncbi:hypothetical protein GCM10027402_32340 [Arthrobacter monumenti]